MDMPEISGFEVLKAEKFENMHAKGWLFRHKKTGARFAVLDDGSPSETYFMGFRTPAESSNGVTHIIEHAILNGCRCYPDKDAFSQLQHGSICTLMTAGTAQDKTMYFYETANEQDFFHLLSYYLDIISHPLALEDDRSFRKEGWHYELDEQGELKVNGVVYTEMKGVHSSSDYMAELAVTKQLYRDSLFRFEAGGEPNEVPDLTYEAFTDYFHRYYHPSNSYFFLSGGMDYRKILQRIDRDYLSGYDYREIHAEYPGEPEWKTPVTFTDTYPAASAADGAYLVYAGAAPVNLSAEHYEALPILADLLCGSTDAPVKKALEEAGLASDVYMLTNTSAKEPLAAIIAKGADGNRRADFESITESVLKDLAENGLDHKKIAHVIREHQLRYFEEDYGWITKGIQLGVRVMDSWMFDEREPFLYVDQAAVYEKLQELLQANWFEGLIREFFLENRHRCLGAVLPDPEGKAKYDAALRKKLAERRASMTQAQLEEIAESERELKAWIDDTQHIEMPVVTRKDLPAEGPAFSLHCERTGKTEFLTHDIRLNGMGRLSVLLSLHSSPLQNMNAAMLFDTIFSRLTAAAVPAADHVSSRFFQGYYRIDLRFLAGETGRVLEQLKAFLAADHRNAIRVTDRLIAECAAGRQAVIAAKGNRLAELQALSSFGREREMENEAYGMPGSRFVCSADAGQAGPMCCALYEAVASGHIGLIDYAGAGETAQTIAEAVKELQAAFEEGCRDYRLHPPAASDTVTAGAANTGYICNLNVNFNAVAGTVGTASPERLADIHLILKILQNRYLEKMIREKGGGYHTSERINRDGTFAISSFRDSRVDGSLLDMRNAAEFFRTLEFTGQEWERCVVGCIGALDKKLAPIVQADRELADYLDGWNAEKNRKFRSRILSVSREELADSAEALAAGLASAVYASIGMAETIENSRQITERVKLS